MYAVRQETDAPRLISYDTRLRGHAPGAYSHHDEPAEGGETDARLVLGELGNRGRRRMQDLTVCQNVPVRGFEAGRDACIGGNHAGHT